MDDRRGTTSTWGIDTYCWWRDGVTVLFVAPRPSCQMSRRGGLLYLVKKLVCCTMQGIDLHEPFMMIQATKYFVHKICSSEEKPECA